MIFSIWTRLSSALVLSRFRLPTRHLHVLKLALFVVVIAVPVGCSKAEPAARGGPPVEPPAGTSWALTFDSEFDGTSLDTTKLTPCFDWNYGECTSSFNEGKEHYLPSQVQVQNGIARLVAEPAEPPYKDDACFDDVCSYKSGLLSTARPNQGSPYLYQFTYGYVESRMKLPTTPGMSTGFWMIPANPEYKYNSEIDILESLGGKPDVIYQTLHYDDRNKSFKVNDITQDTNGKCAKLDYTNDFHTYGVDWQPDYIAYYIDGAECGRFAPGDPSQIPNEPMQIILSLGVDTSWPRDIKLTLPSQDATDHVDVDYIRVWQAHK